MSEFRHYTDSLYHDLEKTARLFRLFAVSVFKTLETDITPDEFITLDTILCNAGICQRDLAKLLLKDRANTGRILNALEEKGYITRFVDMKNNRLVRKMGVTESGKDAFCKITEDIKEHLKSLSIRARVDNNVNEMNEEVENVRKTLKKIRDDIRKVVDTQI